MTKTTTKTTTKTPATTNPVTAERARIRAIISAPEAEGRIDQAQHLAFETDMAPDTAIAILATAPKAPKADLPGDPSGDVATTLAALIAENAALKANGAALVLADAANVSAEHSSPLENGTDTPMDADSGAREVVA